MTEQAQGTLTTVCPRCHQENSPNARFCISCGSALNVPVAKRTSRTAGQAAGPSETLDDLMHGQGVIMWARWILIAAGLILVLWQMESVAQLRVALFLLIGLAIMNFLLYTEVFRRRGTMASLVYIASAADLVVITAIVISGGGFESQSFLFYFPAILAFSVAFPPGVTFTYTLLVMLVYLSVCTATGGDWISIIARLTMLAGVALCGRIYLGVERKRRREMETPQKS